MALSASAASAQQKITFTLNWVAGGDHAPYFYAQKMGWYKDAGVNVEFETGRGSAASAQKVAAGSSQLGLSDMAGRAAVPRQGPRSGRPDERLRQFAAGSLLAQELRHQVGQGSRRQEDRQSGRRRRPHHVAGAGEERRHRSQLGHLGQHRRQRQAWRGEGQDGRRHDLVLQPASRVRPRARRRHGLPGVEGRGHQPVRQFDHRQRRLAQGQPRHRGEVHQGDAEGLRRMRQESRCHASRRWSRRTAGCCTTTS